MDSLKNTINTINNWQFRNKFLRNLKKYIFRNPLGFFPSLWIVHCKLSIEYRR
jgi:hypothetical protein